MPFRDGSLRREDEQLELGSISTLVRRWWALIVASVLVAGATAYFAASRIPPTYEAEVRLVTGPLNTDFDTIRASSQLTETYAELATSSPVLRRALQRAGTAPPTLDEFRKSLAATANEITRVIRIRVESEDARGAATLANSVAAVLVDLSMQPPAQREGRLTIVDPARPAAAPVAPRVSLIVFLAALAAFVGAVAIVVVVEHGRPVVNSRADVSAIDGLEFLGSLKLPKLQKSIRGRPLFDAAPKSRGADAYRVLAAKVLAAGGKRAIKSIVVAGTTAGQGSGIVAVNLAAAVAERAGHVTLVDADTSLGVVSRLLNIEESTPGSNVDDNGKVRHRRAAEPLVVRHSDRLDVLPSGSMQEFGVFGAPTLIEKLLQKTDLVIVACPSLVGSPITLAWLECVDAAVLVAESGRTSRDALDEAARAVAAAGTRVAGVTLARPTLVSAA